MSIFWLSSDFIIVEASLRSNNSQQAIRLRLLQMAMYNVASFLMSGT